MHDYHFIQENSHKKKIKALIITSAALIIILISGLFISNLWYEIIDAVPSIGKVISSVKTDVISTTPLGLFYANFIGGIFFVPSPDEVIFYYGLVKTHLIFLSLIASISGFMLAQLVNYYLGLTISPFILHIVSKKKVYSTRRFINKYGSYGVFLFNFLPFPAPLLTFALGIAKYNFYRLFLITFLGKLCKYALIILLFILISK